MLSLKYKDFKSQIKALNLTMRFVYLIFCLALSCATQKSTDKKGSSQANQIHCPEDGNCTLEVMLNKSLSIKSDGIGALYPHIADGDKMVLKFEYTRDQIPDTVDGHYQEIIYLEHDPTISSLQLKDQQLSKVKATFGRLCFCRGQTGYYPINDGQLTIRKVSDLLWRINFSFENGQVPQVIQYIDQEFQLK